MFELLGAAVHAQYSKHFVNRVKPKYGAHVSSTLTASMLQLYEPQTLSKTAQHALTAFRYSGALSMKAERLINENISALLRARRADQKTLAQWCRRSTVWISYKLSGKRMWTVDELDRVADFFGIATYQLLQPGVADTTERRKGLDRRDSKDRRISQAARVMQDVGAEVGSARTHGSTPALPSSALTTALKRLTSDYESRVSALLSQTEPRGPATRTRKTVTKARPRGRSPSEPDAPDS